MLTASKPTSAQQLLLSKKLMANSATLKNK